MTSYLDSYKAINILPEDIETILCYYKDLIKEAINNNDKNFLIRVRTEHLILLKCSDKLDFQEIILIPIINQITKDISVRRDKVIDFLKGNVLYPRDF
jgi:hypothetical protein